MEVEEEEENVAPSPKKQRQVGNGKDEAVEEGGTALALVAIRYVCCVLLCS